MEEQDFLHQLSVKTDVNIELLKDLYHNESFRELVKTGKTMDAIKQIRMIQARVELREAQLIVQAFSEAT